MGTKQELDQLRSSSVGGFSFEAVSQDVRYGLRMLLKNPLFSLTAACTLALGIGANTAIYSVVNAVLLQPLPYRAPEQLVMFWERNIGLGIDKEQVAPANVLEWQQHSRSVETFGYVANDSPRTRNFLLTTGDQPERVRARFTSSGWFEVLGTKPFLGRTFRKAEDSAGGEDSAVLSYAFWQRHFHGQRDVLGRTIKLTSLNEKVYTIIGVMPPTFRFPADTDLWLSFSAHPFYSPQRYVHDLWVIGRLKSNATLDQARLDMRAIQQRLATAHPEIRQLANEVVVVPLLIQVIGERTRPILFILFGAVGLVLLIACANVANLLLARAGQRHKEVAIRMSVGAGRGRIVRQLLTESILLSLCGGALGVAIAFAGVRLLPTIHVGSSLGVKEFRIDRLAEIAIDAHVLLFALFVSVATAAIFGLLPALSASQLNLNRTLKEEGRSSTGGLSRHRFLKVLLIVEVALSVVLLTAASLLVRSFLNLQKIEVGITPEHVLMAEIDLDMAKTNYSGNPPDITQQIMAQAAEIPGVTSVGAVGEIPIIKSGYPCNMYIDGRPVPEPANLPVVDARIATPNLFSTLGTPILRGRDFNAQDRARSPQVVIVNTTFAMKFFGQDNPIGKHIFVGHPGAPLGTRHRREIIGVVGDIRNFSLNSEVQPEVFFCFRQHPWGGAEIGPSMVFRTQGNPLDVIAGLRQRIEGDKLPGRILRNVRPIGTVLADSAAQERFGTSLMVIFSAAALVLTLIGIYGVMSYSVAQRTHEIGIRMALGAQPHHILSLIMGNGLKIVLSGIALGVLGSLAGARVLAGLLYGVGSTDIGTFVAVAGVVFLVAMAACYMPTHRAMSVNPTTALRYE